MKTAIEIKLTDLELRSVAAFAEAVQPFKGEVAILPNMDIYKACCAALRPRKFAPRKSVTLRIIRNEDDWGTLYGGDILPHALRAEDGECSDENAEFSGCPADWIDDDGEFVSE